MRAYFVSLVKSNNEFPMQQCNQTRRNIPCSYIKIKKNQNCKRVCVCILCAVQFRKNVCFINCEHMSGLNKKKSRNEREEICEENAPAFICRGKYKKKIFKCIYSLAFCHSLFTHTQPTLFANRSAFLHHRCQRGNGNAFWEDTVGCMMIRIINGIPIHLFGD